MHKTVHCTRSSRVHYAHTACAITRTAPRSRAQLAQVARSACASRTHRSQVVGASRDLLSLSIPKPDRDITSRLRPPGRPSHVATSTPCRYLPSAQPNKSGRDLKRGHDTNFQLARSRPQMGSRHQWPVSPSATLKQVVRAAKSRL